MDARLALAEQAREEAERAAAEAATAKAAAEAAGADGDARAAGLQSQLDAATRELAALNAELEAARKAGEDGGASLAAAQEAAAAAAAAAAAELAAAKCVRAHGVRAAVPLSLARRRGLAGRARAWEGQLRRAPSLTTVTTALTTLTATVLRAPCLRCP